VEKKPAEIVSMQHPRPKGRGARKGYKDATGRKRDEGEDKPQSWVLGMALSHLVPGNLCFVRDLTAIILDPPAIGRV